MARIAGVNLPNQKRLEIGLTYIYGIGQPTARKICAALGPRPDTKVRDLTDEEVTKLRALHRRRAPGRGRPAPRALAGDQAPRPRSAAYRGIRHRRGLPVQRPADEDERAHAQGPEEDRRPRQEGEVTGASSSEGQATRGRTRRRVRKNIAIGQAHIKTSFNNTIVALTDKEGNVIAWESAGSAGFKGSRKSTPFAAQVTADSCARKGMEHGLQKVEVFVKGPGSGRETAIRSLQAAGLEILGVKDVTPQAHNGVRPEAEARLDGPTTSDRSAASAAARA